VLLSALEINDTGLVLATEGAAVLVSPGVALIEDQQVLLGDMAVKQSRLKPGKVNSRFWEQLNLDPLGTRTPDVRTVADLAYSHLKSFWRPAGQDQEVILVVPGVYSGDQLGLLLGITNECGIPVSGVVDTAVAASRYSAPDRKLMHLDVHLHRLVLTELEEGTLLRRGRCESIASAGLAPLTELWCNRIADAFVRNTRFDPMHQAESEQIMHDSLPAWLSQLDTHGSSMLELESRGRKYQLMFKREELVKASKELFAQVAQQVASRSRDAGVLVQLTSRARNLPGLVDALSGLDNCQVVFLENNAGVLGAMRHVDQIRSQKDALRFVTSLPWEPMEVVSPGTATDKSQAGTRTRGDQPRATHVVLNGIAYAVAPELVFAPESGGQLKTRPAGDTPLPTVCLTAEGITLKEHSRWLLNGDAATPDRVIRAGDQLQLTSGGPTLLAICMDPGHG
jgi:hypothetical protein